MQIVSEIPVLFPSLQVHCTNLRTHCLFSTLWNIASNSELWCLYIVSNKYSYKCQQLLFWQYFFFFFKFQAKLSFIATKVPDMCIVCKVKSSRNVPIWKFMRYNVHSKYFQYLTSSRTIILHHIYLVIRWELILPISPQIYKSVSCNLAIKWGFLFQNDPKYLDPPPPPPPIL